MAGNLIRTEAKRLRIGFTRKVPYAEKMFPRKGAKRYAFPRGFFAAFAPWREIFRRYMRLEYFSGKAA